MEISEFVEETSKLEKFYGKEMEDVQRKIWYQEFKNLSINRYRQIIMQAYRQCKFMPKLADIYEIQNTLSYGQSKKEIAEKVNCSKCNGLGIVFYKKSIDNGDANLIYDYVARCACQNGMEYSYDGTQISDTEHRSKFYIPIAQQLGI